MLSAEPVVLNLHAIPTCTRDLHGRHPEADVQLLGKHPQDVQHQALVSGTDSDK